MVEAHVIFARRQNYVARALSRALLGVAGGVLAVSLFAGTANAIVNKPFVKPVTNAPPAGTLVDVQANQITYDAKRKVAVATGTVNIVYGPYILNATRVVYDEINDTFKANGSVELREPNGNVLEADRAFINNKFKEGFAEHLKALLNNDVTITADYAKRTADGITVYTRADYTACKLCLTKSGNPVWDIKTTKTIHDNEKKDLYFYNPTLRIAGVPVFYLPYAQQPDPTVVRRTGILPPYFKNGTLYGFSVVTPYFLELGKSADLTFSPAWSYKQGPLADVEYRQRTLTGQFNVRGFGIYQLSPPEPVGEFIYDGDRVRGGLASVGEFSLGSGWSYGWDGVWATDRRFLDNYDIDDRQFLESNAHLTGVSGRSFFDARALHYRTSTIGDQQSEIAYALPYIDSEYTLERAVMGGELSFDWNIYSLHRDDFYTPYNTVNLGTDQTRINGEVRWQRQMISDMGTVFTPFAKTRGDVYITNNVPDPATGLARDADVESRVMPSAGFDLRMPFIANYQSGQSILTPVVQMVAATDERKADSIGNEDAITVNFDSTSIFLEDRFTGLDRYEGGLRANVGLMYSYLGSDGGYARFSVGESFHLGGENSFRNNLESGLSGQKSDLVGAVTWQPNPNFGLSYQARVKEDFSQINTQEAYANFTLGKLTGNLGYLNLSEEPSAGREIAMERLMGGLNYRLGEAWSVYAGATYDFKKSDITSKYAGILFDCDCMTASLTYVETGAGTLTDPFDRTLRFSVELRTLTATSFTSRL